MLTSARFGGSIKSLATIVALSFALLASACSGAQASEASAGTPIEPVEGLTVANDLSGQNVQAAPVTPTTNDINTLYQAYLDAAGQIVPGKAGAEALSGIASAGAAQQVLDDYASNEERRSAGKLSTIDELQMWPNIASIEEGEGVITLIDCTERQSVNSIGQFNVHFVQQQVTIDTSGSAWIIDNVDVMHNGFFEENRQFGCIPPDLGKRAEIAAIDAWSEFTRVSQDPSLIENGLSNRFAPPLGPDLEQYLIGANQGGWVLSTTEEVEFHVLGVDTETSLIADPQQEGKAVIVASCHTFPEGRVRTNTQTGETVEQLPPGAVETQWIYVSLDTKPTGDATHFDRVTRIMPKGSGCTPFGPFQ